MNSGKRFEVLTLATVTLPSGVTEKDFRVVYARQLRRQGQPRRIARFGLTEPEKVRKIRLDKTLCHIFAAGYPESADLSAANCAHCLAPRRKILRAV